MRVEKLHERGKKYNGKIIFYYVFNFFIAENPVFRNVKKKRNILIASTHGSIV